MPSTSRNAQPALAPRPPNTMMGQHQTARVPLDGFGSTFVCVNVASGNCTSGFLFPTRGRVCRVCMDYVSDFPS